MQSREPSRCQRGMEAEEVGPLPEPYCHRTTLPSPDPPTFPIVSDVPDTPNDEQPIQSNEQTTNSSEFLSYSDSTDTVYPCLSPSSSHHSQQTPPMTQHTTSSDHPPAQPSCTRSFNIQCLNINNLSQQVSQLATQMETLFSPPTNSCPSQNTFTN